LDTEGTEGTPWQYMVRTGILHALCALRVQCP
jgi:hypothetical protein